MPHLIWRTCGLKGLALDLMPLGKDSLLIPLFQMRAPKALPLRPCVFQLPSTSVRYCSYWNGGLRSSLLWCHTEIPHLFADPAQRTLSSLVGCKVLLLQWADLPHLQFSCVELFAGVGNVSTVFRRHGKSVASFDKNYHESMDFTQSAGFMPGSEFIWISHTFPFPTHISICLPKTAERGKGCDMEPCIVKNVDPVKQHACL